MTEFRGRGDEIRVNPLSFEEFYHAYEGDKRTLGRSIILTAACPS